MISERLTLWLLLVATFAIRTLHPDQPIVENYVGRQIPTAMVARNLERGSGFLHPQLDTGPFPNLFLVEPPIYAQLVAAVRPILGFELEPTGRLVSAAATALGAWGLFGLVRRREGSTVAFLALASYAVFPVMIRYGRSFQPDALMLGCILAALRGWDEYEAGENWRWAALGGFVLSVGLALKITVAWALIPFVLIVRRWPIGVRIAAAVAMMTPSLAWYVHAWEEVARRGSGSLASSDNAAIWFQTLSPASWLRISTIQNIGRGLVDRSFTVVGFMLAALGLLCSGKVDRLWKGWAIGCGLAVLALSAKWHHAYYWMVVAPLAAVGVGRGLVGLAGRGTCGRTASMLLGSCFLALCLYQSASTWRTPAEWASLEEAAREVASLTTEDQLIIAPEALLHYSGRSGFRLEFDPAACRRAAGEWGGDRAGRAVDDAFALTGFYVAIRSENFVQLSLHPGSSRVRVEGPGRLLVADVGPTDGARRQAWREAIRNRPGTRIVADRPGLMIAELRPQD